jgi:hypothetical protein
MKKGIEFRDEDTGTTMYVEYQEGTGKVHFWLDGPTYRDSDNRDTSDELEFDIDREQAIDIILLLEAAFA